MTTHLSHLVGQPPSVQLESGRMARLLHAFDHASLDAICDFSLRMASHGLSVSSTMMRRDPDYALEQLCHAHALPDEALRYLAASMKRDFEQLRLQARADAVT